jgi:hypothetical protein
MNRQGISMVSKIEEIKESFCCEMHSYPTVSVELNIQKKLSDSSYSLFKLPISMACFII